MRKTRIMLLLMISAILFNSRCLASQNNVYYIDVLPITITLPDSYTVLTRNISEDDKAIKMMGWSFDYAKDYMLNSDRYLDAVSFSDMTEITIILQPNSYDGLDISKFSDDILYVLLEGLKQDKSVGSISDLEVFTANNMKFIKYFMSRDNGLSYYQYSTTFNNYDVTFTFSLFSTDYKDKLNGIADNIMLNNISFGNTRNSDLNSITFTEKNTGTKFELPSGWDVIQEKNSGNLLAVFKPVDNTNKNIYIHYNVYDILSELKKDDLILLINNGKSRKDFDFDYASKGIFNKQFIADSLGVNTNIIISRVIGGVEYYTLYSFDELKSFNKKQKSITYMFITVFNGYLHVFTYGAPCDENIEDISQIDLSDFYKFLSGISFNIL